MPMLQRKKACFRGGDFHAILGAFHSLSFCRPNREKPVSVQLTKSRPETLNRRPTTHGSWNAMRAGCRAESCNFWNLNLNPITPKTGASAMNKPTTHRGIRMAGVFVALALVLPTGGTLPVRADDK